MATDRRDEREKDLIDDDRPEKTDFPTYNVAAPNGLPGISNNYYNDLNEEMASDFAVGSTVSYVPRKEKEETVVEREESGGAALGWVALVFAVASWFLWPILMGLSSVALGYMAYRQGARALGGWAIAIGLIAVLLSAVIVPLYYAII
ncbi:hypothetical protein [Paenibacillus radicis (ex Gao et al. 2016)]|uniref:DUF4190 domain-containing protein n=1 Tax=Paenibacillus radicis (ex Gao et al. 2016) TaxID=1737354 RepID=A0A917LTG6_9BACL|nr:hypothetical protein [Paenibacillus radicis (ex Gao et al. 2016)]GGG56451.1 hypothetical protein GCM10010918_06780 [Paenibacillus radicis (ex Gao et al. 2016)]